MQALSFFVCTAMVVGRYKRILYYMLYIEPTNQHGLVFVLRLSLRGVIATQLYETTIEELQETIAVCDRALTT